MFLAKIIITLHKSMLDPQGKAVQHALQSLHLPDVQEVRIGKFIEMKIKSTEKSQAEKITDEACKKLLANPVMEDYIFSVEKL